MLWCWSPDLSVLKCYPLTQLIRVFGSTYKFHASSYHWISPQLRFCVTSWLWKVSTVFHTIVLYIQGKALSHPGLSTSLSQIISETKSQKASYKTRSRQNRDKRILAISKLAVVLYPVKGDLISNSIFVVHVEPDLPQQHIFGHDIADADRM